MLVMSTYKLTPKSIKILDILLITRGGTIDQLVEAYHENNNPNTKQHLNRKKTMYRTIRELTKAKLIDRYSLKPFKAAEFYFLSEKGLEVAHYIRETPYKNIGEGYGGDLGDFPYSLYKPPSTNILHHMLFVDVVIECMKFKKKLKNSLGKEGTEERTFDFRDNLHASEKFNVKETKNGKTLNKVRRYRPDAEVKIFSNVHSLEIDRMTESREQLIQKFENYKIYFKHLQKQNKPLPVAIVFVGEEKKHSYGLERRWKTITNAFFEVLREYTPYVNLVFERTSTLQEYFQREVNRDIQKKQNHRALQPLFNKHTKNYTGAEVGVLNEEFGNKTCRALDASGMNIHTKKGIHIVFVYIPLEAYETKGWVLAERAEDILLMQIKEDTIEVKPVFYFKSQRPVAPFLPYKKERIDFLKKALYFNI